MNSVTIPISKNASDASFYAPRAVIAILHFKNNKIKTLYPRDSTNKVSSDFVETTPLLCISDDITNLTVASDKRGCSHTLSATLAPGSYNYLGLVSPGDWIVSWIVNSKNKRNDLIKNLKSGKVRQANYFDSGLKFIGQVHTIQEQFQIAGGVKQTRYNLNATGFNPYMTQIVYSPYLNPGEGTNQNNFLFANNFFSNLFTEKGLYNELVDAKFSVQLQLLRLHQVFLGPGPGDQIKNTTAPSLRTVQNGFAVPTDLAAILGLTAKQEKADTAYSFADATTALIGIQKFKSDLSHNSSQPDLGPAFNVIAQQSGTYYVPSDSSYNLVGKKKLGISPTIGGTIWSILQGHLNSTLNEMYVCLRPEPANGDIVPTFVARQIPFSLTANQKMKITLFRDLPRFFIDPDIIKSYDFSKSEALRINTFFLSRDGVLDVGNKNVQDALNVWSGPWKYDVNDVTKNGIKIWNSKISDDIYNYNGSQPDLLQNYNDIISDIQQNSHLKYSGNLSTIGIEEPVTIGENLQIGDILFHIETVTHKYTVANGLVTFMTDFSLSNGIHDTDNANAVIDNFSGLPAQNTVKDDFAQIKGGFIKELGTQDSPKGDPHKPEDEKR